MTREKNNHLFNCPIWIKNDPTEKCECYQPFIDPKDAPKGYKASPFRKSRLGARFNGKHKD